MEAKKLQNVKKAVREYRNIKKNDGVYPHHGSLMFDTSTGELWCDEFWSLDESWIQYHDPAIVNLGAMMLDDPDCVEYMYNYGLTEELVKEYIAEQFPAFQDFTEQEEEEVKA